MCIFLVSQHIFIKKLKVVGTVICILLQCLQCTGNLFYAVIFGVLHWHTCIAKSGMLSNHIKLNKWILLWATNTVDCGEADLKPSSCNWNCPITKTELWVSRVKFQHEKYFINEKYYWKLCYGHTHATVIEMVHTQVTFKCAA